MQRQRTQTLPPLVIHHSFTAAVRNWTERPGSAETCRTGSQISSRNRSASRPLRAVLHYSSWPRPDRRCFCLLTPSRLSAFVNSCFGVRLHLMTSGGSAQSQRCPRGPVSSRVLSVAMFPVFVFSSLSVFSGCSRPGSPPQTVQPGRFHTYSIPPTGKLTVHSTNILTSK